MAESDNTTPTTTVATGGDGASPPPQPVLGAMTVQSTVQDTSIAMPTPGGKVETKLDVNAFIPEAYREKEWVKNTLKNDNPTEAFFSQFENAQKMIGKPANIPGPDATPEQIQEWHKALGVPESKDGYEYKGVEWNDDQKQIGEALDSARVPEIMDGMKEAARQLGITPAQFAGLAKAQDELTVQFRGEAIKESFQKFEDLMDKEYGAEKGKVADAAREIWQRTASDKLKDYVLGLPEEAQFAVTQMAWEMHNLFVKPDKFNPNSTTTASSGMSEADKQRRISELQGNPAWKNKFDPAHPSVMKEWRGLMGFNS